MEKKNNLVKSIFYIFFAVCFLSFGIMFSNKDSINNYVVGEDVSEEEIDNQNIPSYFSAKEYITDGSDTTENQSSLISSDTFMFFRDGNSSNFLTLSLLTNGQELSPQNDIYNYVYYPDLTNTAVFHYYSINSISLYINGADKEINMGDYIIPSGFSFTNNASAQLEQFEMIFKALPDGGEEAMESNEIAITDENGNVIEGIYILSLTITLYTCTDGGSTTEESMFTDQNVTIDYSFYVIDQESYFLNNRPNITFNSFDHTVNVSSLTNPNYAYYLYSNYSSETTANKIPYIEYDYTKFELSITKTLSNSTNNTALLYDKDESSELPVLMQGDQTVNLKIDTNNNVCRIYFKDVGNYELTLNAIQIVDYTIDPSTTETKKYALDGVSGQTKKIMVYMYGYQANYTDFDQPLDENNIRPVGELKEYDFENGTFSNGADITSSFLASNGNYSQTTGNTTFNITNVLNYINTSGVTPVKTNQTPIKLSVNAKLSTSVNSYIYSTTKVSNAYDDTRDYGSITTGSNSEKLYRSAFSGRTDSTAGKYIYIIAYTFDSYYLSETTLSANTVFYQVFYFEIVKDLPTIEIVTTEGETNIPSDTYVNQNVNIIDSTKNDPFNKDVTVQIYAYDYGSDSYLSGFGGEQGISFDALLPSNSTENFITLERSAHYTVRLYYTNEMTASNTLYSSKTGFFREQTFTIDKNPLENIQARNVTEITNSTNYKIVSTLNNFSTNQSIVFSWSEKASGARTYAYYRYFPIIDAQYYSNREATLSTTLDRMLNYSRDNSFLPVNNLLNMSTTDNNWLPYQGNTYEFTTNVATEYVLSDAGLYLIDVYDEAGNHTVDVFMIDNTAPYFAIYDFSSEIYKLTSSSVYVTTPSTLYWAKNKAIYIANFRTISYSSTINPDNITIEDLKYDGNNYYDFYLTYDGKTPCTEIFKVMYNKLFAQNYMQVLNCTVSISPETDGTSSYISGYSGMYITIPINEVSYFIDNDHLQYTSQTGVFSQVISIDEENTYRVLIRDMSNTRKDLAYDDTYVTQYTNYYSARQTIIISFDSSEFFIQFTNSDGETEVLTSNNVSEGIIENADGTQRRTKTTYLSPTSMRKAFVLSFLPTITSEDMLIQVDNVTIKYYPYIEQTITVGDITYHYYTLSDVPTETPVYSFDEHGTMTTVRQEEIRLNSEYITTAGKYEIVRTYYTEDGYSYNENDFYQRTYVFYVDRNEVVTNAELVNNGDSSHLESLVGGDIFVSMYDNGSNASLVVTFPNSTEGNTNGSSIYNNGTVRSILTTNLLPVNVYIPQYKYTTYANQSGTLSGSTELFVDEVLSEPADITLSAGTTILILSASESIAKIVHNGNVYYIPVSAISNYEFGVNYSSYYILTSDAILYTDQTLTSTTTTTLTSGTVLSVEQITSTSTSINYNSNTYYINNSTYAKVDKDNYYQGTNSIIEYALYAEIYKDGTDVSNLVAITSTNSTNPTIDTIVADDSGFLNFYNYSNGTKLDYLSEEGVYYVTIYQGRFGTEVGDNNFQQSLTFSFEIKESNPDFVAQSITGSALNSVVTSPAPTDETRPSLTYYTNQSSVSLLWNAGSAYMAEIDIDEIVFRTSKGQTFKATDDVFLEQPTLSNNQYIAQLDLKKLNIYENNGYVDITMQYKNHDSRFYSKVTKRIYVDLSAPNTNIQNLVSNSVAGNLIAPLTTSALRTYYTADMEQTNSLTSTSYNVSNNTGIFAYYSYSVTNSYLQTLKNSLSSEVFITYVREFVDANGNNTKYVSGELQETAPTDFLPSNNFTDITSITELKTNTYYEVIEMDRAGNMAIYTIYVTSYVPEDDENSTFNNLITYTDADGNQNSYTIEDYQLTQSHTNATHNIYAKTGFALNSINFFGDAWAQIKLDTVNASGNTTTRYLMLTPWDRENAYAFIAQTYSTIAISDLIDGSISSRFKNCLSIYNRENRSTTNFYINVRNTTLTATLTNDQNREFIRFSKPTDEAIQNTVYSSTFLTGLSIKANNEVIFSQTNKLGFASIWQSNSNVTVTIDGTLGTITFEINPSLGFTSNTRIEYEYTDNYGTTLKEIHLYRETLISQEVSSEQDLYSYYDSNGGCLYYITKDGFQYNYNPSKYTVTVRDLIDGTISENETLENATTSTSQNSQGISTVLVKTNDETGNYNDSFALIVRDFNNPDNETNLVKTIYFTLYNELPMPNYGTENNDPGEFKILDANGINITEQIINGSVDDETGYYSEITIIYSQKETFIPIKYSISTDKITWTEISTGTRLQCETEEMQTYYLKIWYDETYLTNEMGTPEYVFGYVPDGGEDSQIFEFNLSSLTSTYWVENTLTGTIVEKDDSVYISSSGEQFANHYIVNLSYSDREYIQIKTNREQYIDYTLVETYTENSPVISEYYIINNNGEGNPVNIPPFNIKIIITYIPPSDNFVEEFYTYNMNGIIDTTENLINVSSKSVVISQDYASIDRIELQWSKYYGIPENEIKIRLVKDGVELSPVVYTRKSNDKEYSYIFLTHSGKYSISLYDDSGNVQKFNRGNAGQTESLSFIFLKDVPFTITYTDPVTNEEKTSLPIKQAIYNGSVTINIDRNSRSEFYSLDGYPVISVKKDKVDYTGFFQDDTTYVFSETGYYEITFTATSNIPNVGPIRQETYQFTILNPNEHRYSYVYNRYSNYYVEKVIKDDVDVTEDLLRTLDVSTITVNQKTYMTELPLSYLDEKTGAGTYLITINSNDKLFQNSSEETTWTYKVIIQVGNAPIRISVDEGAETTSTITVSFNQANAYNEMGESTIRILRYVDDRESVYYSLDITSESSGEVVTEIDSAGTFYIQILSPSGNLLFSYKVVKNEPLNAAAIIAIVISVVVLIAVIIIIVKLRKRIRVK